MDASNPWIVIGSPCSDEDRDLFAAATRITVGNGHTAWLWNSSWLHGLCPRDIAQRSLSNPARKTARSNNFWISDIDISNGFTLVHIQQFADHHRSCPRCIIWKFTKDGIYAASSAYMAQFEGLSSSDLVQLVWKVWAPPRCNFFA